MTTAVGQITRFWRVCPNSKKPERIVVGSSRDATEIVRARLPWNRTDSRRLPTSQSSQHPDQVYCFHVER